MRPVITLLTDFGPTSTAVCSGVMVGICPEATIIVINHQITRYSIAEGASTLVVALPSMPVGTHVAVVDPGVGTDRLALAIRTARGDVLIGPDNGLLVGPAEALGGIAEVRSIESRELMLPVISSSFHGRDVFAPVAAHLAAGMPLERVGPPVPAERLVRLPEPRVTIRDGVLETEITRVLLFGNVTFAGGAAELEAALGRLEFGRQVVIEFDGGGAKPAVRDVTTWERAFGRVPVGASLLFIESEGQLSFADNQGDAARRLGLAAGQAVRIRAG
jgi:S-adenosylmethionine hydrolase